MNKRGRRQLKTETKSEHTPKRDRKRKPIAKGIKNKVRMDKSKNQKVCKNKSSYKVLRNNNFRLTALKAEK